MEREKIERQIREVYSTLMYGLLKLDKRIRALEAGGGGGGGRTPRFELSYSTSSESGSFMIPQNGTYMVICATSYGQTHTVSIPSSATVIDAQSTDLGNGRGLEITIAMFSSGDTVSISQTWGNWPGRVFAVIRLDNIIVGNNYDFEAIGDAATTVTIPGGSKHLVVGVAMGRTFRNDTILQNAAMILTGNWGNDSACAIYLTDKTETYSFYGYDGGLSGIGAWNVT